MSEELAQSLRLLSAMITPAILILACASIIGTTVQRLIRIGERTRDTADMFAQVTQADVDGQLVDAERTNLFGQVQLATRRTRILQLSVEILHVAIALFIATVGAIGLAALTDQELIGAAPAVLALFGVMLMLVVSAMLIYDSRVGTRVNDDEMDRIVMLSQMRATECSTEIPSRPAGTVWLPFVRNGARR